MAQYLSIFFGACFFLEHTCGMWLVGGGSFHPQIICNGKGERNCQIKNSSDLPLQSYPHTIVNTKYCVVSNVKWELS